ncbi:GNAT family N-acetyltransferase [Paenibacillus sp. RU4T]
MLKKLYVIRAGKPVEATIRRYGDEDAEGLIRVQEASFPPPYPHELLWNREQIRQHAARFPEGALCAVVEGEIVGSMTGMLTDGRLAGDHDWAAVTDSGYIRNHDPQGDTLYVVDICVTPEYRKSGIGKWLMQTMYETVVHLGKARLLGGGRLPGYHRHAAELKPQQYVDAVLKGDLHDPVLTFLLRCGRMPAGIAENYLEDEESCHYAALMEWRNPFLIREPKN